MIRLKIIRPNHGKTKIIRLILVRLNLLYYFGKTKKYLTSHDKTKNY